MHALFGIQKPTTLWSVFHCLEHYVLPILIIIDQKEKTLMQESCCKKVVELATKDIHGIIKKGAQYYSKLHWIIAVTLPYIKKKCFYKKSTCTSHAQSSSESQVKQPLKTPSRK